jgi:hypothetical protein
VVSLAYILMLEVLHAKNSTAPQAQFFAATLDATNLLAIFGASNIVRHDYFQCIFLLYQNSTLPAIVVIDAYNVF